MAVSLVKFEPFTRATAKPHAVYARSHWTDPWTKIPWLFCDHAQWTAAPSIGSAQLAWDYGFGRRQGELSPQVITRLIGNSRWLIRVAIDTHPQKIDSTAETAALSWYGTLELTMDQLDGVRRLTVNNATYDTSTGRQKISAYSLAHELTRVYVRQAWWRKTSDGTQYRIERPLVFNAPDATGRMSGNRSSAKTGEAYAFSDKLIVDDAFWSTRDVVEYLCERGGTLDRDDNQQIKLYLDSATKTLLPDWDRVNIDPTGKSLWELLCEAMPRSRMLGFDLRVILADPNDPDSSAALTVVPFTLAGSDITTTEGTLLANPNQRRIEFDKTFDAAGAVKNSAVLAVDRVRFRGSRRTSTATFSYNESTLAAGWPTALETEYKKGASEDTSYIGPPALTTDEKQAANAEARSADKLQAVYRRLIIPESWDGRVRDGQAGGDFHAVFPLPGKETAAANTVADTCFPLNPRELRLDATLALKDGYDYSAISSPGSPDIIFPATRVSDGPHNRLEVLALFRQPETPSVGPKRWVHGEKIAEAAAVEKTSTDRNRRLAVRTETARADRAILLEVHGAPRHAIFPNEFLSGKLPIDGDVYGRWDWRQAVFTITLLDDRYCEGVWPEKAAIDAANERVRELVLDLGEKYRQDWLVPGTVIGHDPKTGQLVRSTYGGWINNDTKRLTAKAKLCFEYYRDQRRALEFATGWVNSAVKIGDYVTEIGDIDRLAVGSVVTEISVEIPEGDDVPTISYGTTYVELEALRGLAIPTRGDGAIVL